MKINEYQKLANVTNNKNLDFKGSLCMAALGVAGEGGEMADIVKKHVYHEHDLDRDHLVKEIGDTLWYLANMATALGVDLEDVAEINIAKLKARYGDAFDVEKSKNRVPE